MHRTNLLHYFEWVVRESFSMFLVGFIVVEIIFHTFHQLLTRFNTLNSSWVLSHNTERIIFLRLSVPKVELTVKYFLSYQRIYSTYVRENFCLFSKHKIFSLREKQNSRDFSLIYKSAHDIFLSRHNIFSHSRI